MRPTSPIEATDPSGVAGRCLCGAFAFTHAAPVGAITACHCTQCRKLSGHYAASFDADEGRLAWTATGDLGTWAGPAGSTRGFCRTCGASLWFRDAAGTLSIEAGQLVAPTGGRLTEHIFTGNAGDYYDPA